MLWAFINVQEKTYEKLQMAARAIVAIENPQVRPRCKLLSRT